MTSWPIHRYWLFASLLLLSAAAAVAGAPAKPTEFEVKAAYLFNFGKFIKWPAEAKQSDSFSICVLGRDPFGDALDSTVRGESIDGKRLLVRRITRADESTACRIVYISTSEERRLKELLPVLSKSSALTVSDIPGFVDAGGMVQFVVDGGRVRFQVNLASAKRQGLTMSSDLLKVATAVKTDSAGGS